MPRLGYYFVLSLIIPGLSQILNAQGMSGEWTNAEALPTARQEMPLPVLDGKIHVPGGFLLGGQVTNLAEIYDPETDSWSEGTPLPLEMHHLHMAAALGKLYVLGGYQTSSFSPTNRVFELDPDTNSWNEKTRMPSSRGAGIAVSLDDKIYVIGGQAFSEALRTNEMYDPETDMWTPLAPMATAREHLAAAVIDSLIYVVGGRTASLTNLPTLEVYSPRTNSWRTLENMPTARGGLAATAANGRLYVFGGEYFTGISSGVFSETEEYDPVTDTWRQLARMPVPRHGMGAATIGDKIYIIGGGPVAGYGVSSENSIFTPPSGVTNVETDEITPERFTLLQNYPNPFNPSTSIGFHLAVGGEINLTVYNLNGQLVRTLYSGSPPPGQHQVTWDGADFRGTNVASGIYVYKLVSAGLSQFRKMTLLR